MQFVDEFRDREQVRRWLDAISATVTKPWTIMEVCGGQTHSIVKHGIDQLLPELVTLVHGPGCPVCVTPLNRIDAALEVARRPEVTLCSFGDMLRVPGSAGDLFSARASGADVRVVYSPLDAVKLAQEHPEREVVFFSVGFETTTPATALAVRQADALGLKNFSLLAAHVLVPPAIEAILGDPENRVQGFIAAGHVCTVMGYWEYEPIVERYGVPIVVTGFEPVDILQGVHGLVSLLEGGKAEVDNRYARLVTREGNPAAQELVSSVFEPEDRAWRGIGVIPKSGVGLREAYRGFDAQARFELSSEPVPEDPACCAGDVLRGRMKPRQCPEFGKRCTPEHPLGAPMVSSEGACAAYHAYGADE